MPAQRDLSVLRKEVHHSSIGSMGSVKVLSAVAVIGLATGLFFFLPEESDSEPAVASAAADVPETTATPDESFCDKQAWPYVDQRCAKRVEAARGTRQVRIVTDKGHSVTTVTPLPIVEPKPKPASPAPTVAQANRPLGPPVAPAATEPPPQTQTVATAPEPAPAPQSPAPKAAAIPASSVQVTVAPANRPAATDAMVRENPKPPAEARNVSVAPSAASTAPAAPGFDAFAEVPKKSKSARAAEKAEMRALKKAEKREAKRGKSIEEDNSGVADDDVVAAVKSAPAGGRNSRTGRREVPDEVVQAVEEASANDGRRGRGVVTIGSPSGGQRTYVVPREEASGW